MKKAIAVILACIMLLAPLAACTDAKELNTWAYAYFIGIDKGVAGKLRFTILIPTLKEGQQGSSSGGSGEGSQQSGETNVISIDCPTIYSGLNQMNTFLSRRVNYMHAKYLIIGEEIAKEGITPFMEGMRIARQIRLNMHVAVVKGEASEFIEAFNPTMEASIPRTLEGTLEASESLGLTDHELYLNVLQDLKSTKKQASCAMGAVNDFSAYLPAGSEAPKIEPGELLPGEIPRKGGNPVEFLGTAVFRGDKLVGELNLMETRSLLMVKDEYISGSITIHDPLDAESFVTIVAQPQKNTDIKVTLTDLSPVIDIKVYIEGSIQNQQSEIRYQTEELKPELEKAFAQFITTSIGDTIKKCQDLNSDIFAFGEVASMQFWTIQEWENYGWHDRFKDATVNIEVSVIIRRTGVVVENNPINKEDGGQ
jgi:spore germination protein KC